jgi:hypothetical protein
MFALLIASLPAQLPMAHPLRNKPTSKSHSSNREWAARHYRRHGFTAGEARQANAHSIEDHSPENRRAEGREK